MERREAVIKISWILKSAYLAPSVFTGLLSCKADVPDYTVSVLNKEQHVLATGIMDAILPRTETPSASDVQVDQYMDLLLKDVFEEKYRNSFLNGLEQFDKNCKEFTGKKFLDLTELERYDYLNVLDKKTSTVKRIKTESFFSRFKELTVSIYFSTEQGVKQNLDYSPLPGPYMGDIELKEGAKITKGN